jgi:hypothetical protein
MQCGGKSSCDDWPPDSRLQSSPHSSSLTRKKSKTREDGAARLRDDDDASSSSPDSSPEDSSQRSKGSGISGSGQKRHDSAFQDSSKEWMFHGTVAIHNTVDWDRSDVAEDRRMLAERITESFADCGQSIKRSLSDHALASIDCTVIISNIYVVTDDLHHGVANP